LNEDSSTKSESGSLGILILPIEERENSKKARRESCYAKETPGMKRGQKCIIDKRIDDRFSGAAADTVE
jgi:hypothetical protein